ncbi:DUF5360 family protein [Clostridium saccharobutylicum]|uniref:YvaD family protein n=2 Tax=Clostridium saccharobutylicum TaxID=169679 RepID=U5MUV0_CLOSA|nr:DUF5360 family protein [Clostridium saccharobutylicum]AGX44559.1 hypothetical protein CLSA_c35980 [Clostridium saccharobutylicum DSM 13864]AQR91850.1 hypothetical protein CLOSC_35780 [Clostridium saccharobutylicum]AQS01752.1 hypothetical protein CSACC_35830 [Clostridium saccharobutylicum]AQS11356.1 hypothetical protein CLOBY_35120 [Clostridium saccharobutylicum]AQS15735.1 hypothetical protein CLOSACC_35830 [Clostridium saccharobutylicum]
MKKLKVLFLFTDIGFIIYWLITALHLIPINLAFKDYNNPILVDWNWSFFPLDMFISLTGFLALYFLSKKSEKWKMFCLCSLILTFCSGLQAVAFWALRNDFDLTWWVFNLYLLIYPLPFIYKLINGRLA